MKDAFAQLPPAVRGGVFMMLAAASWAALIVLVRVVSARYSVFEILFFRNLVSLLILLPWIVTVGRSVLRTDRVPMHGLRTALAYLGMLGLLYGIARIPAADVVALQFTQPLFIAVLAALIFGETVGVRRRVALVVGFAGILVIVRPGFVEVNLATVVVVVSALTYAGSNICIKSLMRTDSPVQSTIYVNLMMLPLSLVPAGADWVTPTAVDLLWLIGVGIAGTLGIYFASRAYAAAEASAVVPYDFMRLPFTAFGAYVLFAEPIGPWTIAGALIIFASSYALVRFESREAST